MISAVVLCLIVSPLLCMSASIRFSDGMCFLLDQASQKEIRVSLVMSSAIASRICASADHPLGSSQKPVFCIPDTPALCASVDVVSCSDPSTSDAVTLGWIQFVLNHPFVSIERNNITTWTSNPNFATSFPFLPWPLPSPWSPSIFLLHDLSVCTRLPLNLDSGYTRARLIASSSQVVFPPSIFQRLNVSDSPQTFSATLTVRPASAINFVSLGSNVAVASGNDDAVVDIGLGAILADGTRIVFGNDGRFIILSSYQGLACPDYYKVCPSSSLMTWNYITNECEDLCSGYFFQEFDFSTNSCRMKSSVIVGGGIVLLILVLAEVALLVVEILMWRQHNQQPQPQHQ